MKKLFTHVFAGSLTSVLLLTVGLVLLRGGPLLSMQASVSQGVLPAVTQTGAYVAAYSAPSVPNLAAGACYQIHFIIDGYSGSPGGMNFQLFVDSTAVATVANNGGNAWRQTQFEYCNDAAVQNTQHIAIYYEAYCGGTGATCSTGWTADYPEGVAPTMLANIDWSIPHAVSIKTNGTSGTVIPVNFRISQ
jgi:hypothetical protein